MKGLNWLVIPAAMLVLAATVAAQTPGETFFGDSTQTILASPATDLGAAEPSLTATVLPSLTRIGFGLLLVVLAIYGTILLLRRLSGRRFGGATRNLQVVEQTFLAPKKSICLLKLADRAVLVAVTENNVSLLTEMPWEQLPASVTQPGVSTGRFAGFLQQAAGHWLKSNPGRGGVNEKAA